MQTSKDNQDDETEKEIQNTVHATPIGGDIPTRDNRLKLASQSHPSCCFVVLFFFSVTNIAESPHDNTYHTQNWKIDTYPICNET